MAIYTRQELSWTALRHILHSWKRKQFSRGAFESKRNLKWWPRCTWSLETEGLAAERIISGGDAVVHVSVHISFYLISRTNYCLKLMYTGLLTSFFNWLFYMESDIIIKQQNVIMNWGLHLKNKLCYFFRLVKHRLLSVIFLGRTVVSVHSLSS